MKVAAWRTGHSIADTVMGAIDAPSYLASDHSDKLLVHFFDAHIAYGILRGTTDVFRECVRQGKPWIHLDRGYWKPGHYDGYYRVSLCGTQQVTGLNRIPPDYDRLRALGIEMKPWRGPDPAKPILICPPTDEVRKFFAYEAMALTPGRQGQFYVRVKEDPTPLVLGDYSHVITFNSSVGWQALAAGIPCISDPTHSIVGSWFKDTPLMDNLAKRQESEREQLFGVMARLQMTLGEMQAGDLWELVNLLMSSSAMTQESHNAAMLPLTA